MNELINYPDDGGSSPLSACASSEKKGATKCIELLLSNGAILDDVDEKGYTPLMKAAYGKPTLIIRYLNFHIKEGIQIVTDTPNIPIKNCEIVIGNIEILFEYVSRVWDRNICHKLYRFQIIDIILLNVFNG